MYEIIRAEGQTRHAFRDELKTLAGKAFSLRNPDTRDRSAGKHPACPPASRAKSHQTK